MHKKKTFKNSKIGKCCVDKIRDKHIRDYRNRKNNKHAKHIIGIVEWNDNENCPVFNGDGQPLKHPTDEKRTLNGTFRRKEVPIEDHEVQNETNDIEASPVEEIVVMPENDPDDIPIIEEQIPEHGIEVKARRSNRKPKSVTHQERQDFLKNCCRSKKEEGVAIQDFGQKNRGIVTTMPFKKDDFVIQYIGDLMSATNARAKEEIYAQDATIGCYSYYFEFGDDNWCIDATEESKYMGRLINHSRKNPNLKPKKIEVDGLPHLIFLAKRDIGIGEELLFDYGDRSKEALEHHPWLAK